MGRNPVLYELAQFLDAGLDPISATGRIHADTVRDRQALERLRSALARGRSLATGLSEAGYTDTLDTAIVAVGEQAGKLTAALHTVARRAEHRHARTARLHKQLWLPHTMFALMLGIDIVRALTAGTVVSTALADAALLAIPVLGLAYAILTAARCDATAWLRIAWRTKLIDNSSLAREVFNDTFYTLFAWQAAAGVDFIAGAETLAALIDEPRYRRRVARYRAALGRGESVTSALASADLLQGGELRQVLDTAEHAGRIAAALEHYFARHGERLERIADTVFAWLPRGYYAAVFVIGGSTLL